MTEMLSGPVYTGRGIDPMTSAARARRRGWLFFAEHQLRNMRRYGWPILVADIGQPILYLVAMGLGLGAVVDANAGPVDGVDYLTFVAPALLVSTVVMKASEEMTYPVMEGFKWRRTYFGTAASPVGARQIAVGHLAAVSLRFLAVSVFFWLLMLLFGAATGGWSWLVIPVGVLSSLAFAAPLQAYAATLRDEGFQFAFVQRFIVMPMFLFAGTFFELSSMPGYLQWIGWVSPVWHGTELARMAGYGRAIPPAMVAVHVGFLAACTLVGVLLARRIYARRLSE